MCFLVLIALLMQATPCQWMHPPGVVGFVWRRRRRARDGVGVAFYFPLEEGFLIRYGGIAMLKTMLLFIAKLNTVGVVRVAGLHDRLRVASGAF